MTHMDGLIDCQLIFRLFTYLVNMITEQHV